MFGRKKKFPGEEEMQEKLNYLQMNLENNYKDEAWRGFRESSQLLEELKAKGEIPNKKLEKWETTLKEYAKKMEGYGHNVNLLKFDL